MSHYYRTQGKVVGHTEGDTYIRDIKPQHFCYKYKGYGIQEEILRGFPAQGITTIKLIAKDKTYLSTVSDWLEKATLDDLGHGTQFFMPISLMQLSQ